MSRLLKKHLEPGITAFGFPAIERVGNKTDEPAGVPAEPETAPAPDLEELYRKKVLELERRAQEIEKEAYAKGFAQGEKDGFEYGQKGVRVIQAQLERIAEKLDVLPEQVFGRYRDWLVETSLKLARHVVQRELETNPQLIEKIVADLLEEAGECAGMTVRLNPGDYEFLEKRAGLALCEGRKRLTIKPDGSLERGGCVLESEVQLLDASIEARFENLSALLAAGRAPEEQTDAVEG